MASFNRVILIGNLTRDPELKYIPSGSAIAEFGIATNRRFKRQDGSMQDEVTYVNISAWGPTGEFVKKYFTKGKAILVEGRLKYDEWTTPEGQKRNKLTVVAESVHFAESKGGDFQGEGGGGPPHQRMNRPPQNQQRPPQDSGGYGGGDEYGGGQSHSDFGGGMGEEGPADIPF